MIVSSVTNSTLDAAHGKMTLAGLLLFCSSLAFPVVGETKFKTDSVAGLCANARDEPLKSVVLNKKRWTREGSPSLKEQCRKFAEQCGDDAVAYTTLGTNVEGSCFVHGNKNPPTCSALKKPYCTRSPWQAGYFNGEGACFTENTAGACDDRTMASNCGHGPAVQGDVDTAKGGYKCYLSDNSGPKPAPAPAPSTAPAPASGSAPAPASGSAPSPASGGSSGPKQKCSAYTCPTGYLRKSDAFTGADYVACCDASCSVFKCDGGKQLKKNPGDIVGANGDTCCEAIDPPLIINVWLAVFLSFIIAVLATVVLGLVAKMWATNKAASGNKQKNNQTLKQTTKANKMNAVVPDPAAPANPVVVSDSKQEFVGEDGNTQVKTPAPAGASAVVVPTVVIVASQGPVATGESAAGAAHISAVSSNPVCKFIFTELADVITENAIFYISWGEGDLNFAEDGKNLKYFLMALNLFSFCSFIVELGLLMFRKTGLRDRPNALLMLRLVHLGVEDVWQMNLFIIVGLSRAVNNAGGPSAGLWVAALAQSLVFLGVRCYDVFTSL